MTEKELHLLLNLAVIAGIVVIIVVVKYFWFKSKPAPSAAEMWLKYSVEDCDEIIRRITTAKNNRTLEKVEVDIEVFENHYANLIPLEPMQEMVLRMYSMLDDRKVVLNQAAL